jgi:hypothetical protein
MTILQRRGSPAVGKQSAGKQTAISSAMHRTSHHNCTPENMRHRTTTTQTELIPIITLQSRRSRAAARQTAISASAPESRHHSAYFASRVDHVGGEPHRRTVTMSRKDHRDSLDIEIRRCHQPGAWIIASPAQRIRRAALVSRSRLFRHFTHSCLSSTPASSTEGNPFRRVTNASVLSNTSSVSADRAR